MLDRLTAETFDPLCESRFRIVYAPDSAVESTLARVSRWGSTGDGGRQPFTLYFLGPLNPILPQRIYRLEHEMLEPLDVFLVPTGPDKGQMGYEAVFN